jgi:hypothetical protein
MIGSTLMIIAGTVMLAGILLELCAVITAPLGYQDETGFHAGAEHGDEEDGWPALNAS